MKNANDTLSRCASALDDMLTYQLDGEEMNGVGGLPYVAMEPPVEQAQETVRGFGYRDVKAFFEELEARTTKRFADGFGYAIHSWVCPVQRWRAQDLLCCPTCKSSLMHVVDGGGREASRNTYPKYLHCAACDEAWAWSRGKRGGR